MQEALVLSALTVALNVQIKLLEALSVLVVSISKHKLRRKRKFQQRLKERKKREYKPIRGIELTVLRSQS